jgi:GMP synthase-like glutamine amidotransferase
MKIACLTHVPFEGPAWIAEWAGLNGHSIHTTALYEGQALPGPADQDALVVMGGPMGVQDDHLHHWLAAEKQFIQQAVAQNKIVLGICLGAQLIAAALGGRVYPNPRKEIGWFPVHKTGDAEQSPLGNIFPDRFTALHWHGDTFDLPEGAVHLAASQACHNQAFQYKTHVLGLQFHLEATRPGLDALIENCRHELTPAHSIQSEKDIRTGYSYIDNCNALMSRLLDHLFAVDA